MKPHCATMHGMIAFAVFYVGGRPLHVGRRSNWNKHTSYVTIGFRAVISW